MTSPDSSRIEGERRHAFWEMEASAAWKAHGTAWDTDFARYEKDAHSSDEVIPKTELSVRRSMAEPSSIRSVGRTSERVAVLPGADNYFFIVLSLRIGADV